MSSENEKCIKKTTADQLQKLKELMKEFPHLATGSPTFGISSADLEQTWNTVAQHLNAYGPPERNGDEWKKVWQDQKIALEKQIGENNKSSGQVFEMSTDTKKLQLISSSQKIVFDVTPPRNQNKVAVVTPTMATTSKQSQVTKRKINEDHTKNNKQLKLLRKQLKVQGNSLDAMRTQAEAIKTQAESAKFQAEVAKAQAEAVKAQSDALKEIAVSSKVIADAMVDFLKHLANRPKNLPRND